MKLTREPWHKDGNTIYSLAHAGWRKGIEQFKNRLYAHVQKDKDVSDDEQDAAANIMLDAFNTYHATGLTPSELAAQRDELLAALRNLFDALDDIRGIDLRDYKPNEILAAENAITNATKGGEMNRYPWPEMQVGEVREITSDKPINVIRSAASMYSLKQQKKTGERPKYAVTKAGFDVLGDPLSIKAYYRVERTA